MKLKLGENIKFLRKTQDITQENLAEILGVSCQSVSRWEAGVCYPDLELLPIIAEIFHVSLDNLIGVDDTTEKEKVAQYLQRFQLAISRGKIDECISTAREGVAEYPHNYTLLNKLMYALFVSGDDTGDIPGWQENREKYDAEIIALGERIMNYCPDQNIRLEATARLAFQHIEMGRKELGRSLYDTLPSKEFCRENQIWWGLEEAEKLPFLRQEIRSDYESLKSRIWSLGSSGYLSPEESILAYHKVFELERLICDGNLPQNSWGNARMHYELARIYAGLGKMEENRSMEEDHYKEEMYDNLKIAAEAAKAFDNRPESQCYENILLGTIVETALSFETVDDRPITEQLRDVWLSNAVFDPYRKEEPFQQIIFLLSQEDDNKS